MSVFYRAVQWNGHKRAYDGLIVLAIATYLAAFIAISVLTAAADHAISPPILLMRATGTCAFVLLHVILMIGPLCRLDRRFLPLLYNRRHLGVATFMVSAVHALLVVGFYHGFGIWFPLVSLLASNTQYGSVSAFPFETLGIVGFVILFLMAATSHDFWLKLLTPRVWKSLHMLVYVAYGSLVTHVALGAMQSERHPVYVVLTLLGVVIVSSLHLIAGWKESLRDRRARDDAWLDAGPIATLEDGRGRSVCGVRERIAVFRFGDRLSALSGTCAHQGGPIGEGRIVGGCVTCPWHGYQYRPEDACSPPPFTEKLPTYPIKIQHGHIYVRAEALPPGTDASIPLNDEQRHVEI